jgi:hypothetical protein
MRRGRRAGVAVLLGICGIAIVASARISWVSARGARPASGISGTSLSGLFTWSYQPCQSFVSSFGFAVIVAGTGVFLGGLLASRLVASLFSFLALAAAGLWIGLNVTHYSPVDLPASDLRAGAWLAVGGGVVGLLSSPFLRRRRDR